MVMMGVMMVMEEMEEGITNDHAFYVLLCMINKSIVFESHYCFKHIKSIAFRE